MTKVELAAIEAFLESPWDTPGMHEALDELIRMADMNRYAQDEKNRSRLARKDGFQ